MTIQTPQDLVAILDELFPGFRDEWDEDEAYGYSVDYTFHAVFTELAPVCARFLAEASPHTLKSFCILIDEFVSSGGKKENAVSTCLLEHASHVGIAKTLKPYLSQAAKSELR